jgi:hypothetical protein
MEVSHLLRNSLAAVDDTSLQPRKLLALGQTFCIASLAQAFCHAHLQVNLVLQDTRLKTCR